MAAVVTKGRNEPPPPPVIVVKKVVEAHHEAHHGGAWKIAYADFVTAMMAFFLLMWLVGATDEQQRKGLADYFTPTLIEYKQNSAGSDGILQGDSIVSAENYPNRAGQTGMRTIVLPRDATGGVNEASGPQWQETQRFAQLKEELIRRIERNPDIRDLQNHISFTQTDEGLRIDLVDQADYSMFEVGTDRLTAKAQQLVREVAQVIQGVPNRVVIRGHTDSRPFASGQTMNNWLLSTARAETTRTVLERTGVMLPRFSRIEGVADREPFVPGDRLDPRNRRISITLVGSSPAPAPPVASRAAAGAGAAAPR
jgi:chemotaxis protein MotB